MGKYDFRRFRRLSDGRWQKPDEEGGEEASADPNVEDCGITKLGDVSTDPVVQQKHIEDAGDGKRKKKTDVCNKGNT